MRTRTVLVLVACQLIACASGRGYWKPGGTSGALDADRRACLDSPTERVASSGGTVSFFAPLIAVQNAGAYDRCLRARGWRSD